MRSRPPPNLIGCDVPKILVFSTDLDFYSDQLLSGLCDKGYEIHVVLDPRKTAPDKWSPKLKMEAPVALKGRFDRKAIKAYAEQMDRIKPDICLCYTSRALAIALRAGNTAHRDFPIVGTRGAVGGVSAWYPLDWLTYLNPKLDCVVCFSDAIKNRLEHEARRLWPSHPGRFATIYQGYSSLVSSAAKRDHEQRANSDPKVLMTIANERPIKGLKLLLDALEKHIKAENWQLVCVGQVGEATQQRIESSARLKGRVTCTGFRPDARSLLAQADIYIQPTLSPGEGIGNAIAEAMAAELPVITSNVGGALELVQAVSPHLLFQADDPAALARTLDQALQESATYQSIGVLGREALIKKFSVEAEIANYRDLFEGLMAMPRLLLSRSPVAVSKKV